MLSLVLGVWYWLALAHVSSADSACLNTTPALPPNGEAVAQRGWITLVDLLVVLTHMYLANLG
jgi:hypothetical protein